MTSKFTGAIIVDSSFWAKPGVQNKWKKALDKIDTGYRIFDKTKNRFEIKKSLAKFLNETTAQEVFLIDTTHTSPSDLATFFKSARHSDNQLFLQSNPSITPFHKILSKNLHHGHEVLAYSPLKLLPQSLCYNLKPSDLSFGTDHAIIHLATLMSLSIQKVETKIISKKRHLLQSSISHLSTRLSPPRPYHLLGDNSDNMLGAGMVHRGKTFITHTTLKEHHSATNTFTVPQALTGLFILLVLIAGVLTYPRNTMIAFTAVLSTIYFIDVLFNLFLVGKSLQTPPELKFTPEEVASLKDEELPIYTILVPLFREALVLPGFVESISKMNYPQSKLDVLLLMEEDDKETIDVANSLNLPAFIRQIIVPHSMPKSKPKACNYGLAFAKGEYLVIYDAEDHPDADQLKKAILGFRSSPPEVACLQAKLNYHNANQNLLTRFFTAEYSLWFDVVLPGMQSINTSIPLGGTSNHFRVKDIIKFRGWDAFNVTEDADLGSRLFRAGYRTAIVDSVTLEEANSKVGNWIRQRSRWIKGYMQTYLVHTRDWRTFYKEQGLHAVIFQLSVGGKIAFMLINPLLWVMTISYFALYKYVGPTIESFYPTPVFYMAAFSLVFGNFLFLYYYMIGVAKHGHWTLVKWVFLVPLYWLLLSRAALKALYQLVVNPHYWEKTDHGLHFSFLAKKQAKAEQKAARKNNHKVSLFFLTAILNVLNLLQKLTTPKPSVIASFGKPNRSNLTPSNDNVIPGSTRNPESVIASKAKQSSSIASSLRDSYSNRSNLIPSRLTSSFKKAYYHPQAGSIMLIIASVLGNFLNFVYSAYLGNTISLEQFGLISLFGSFLYLTQIPTSIFGSSVTRESAFYFGKEKTQPKHIWKQFRRWGIYFSLILTVIWLLSIPFLRSIFKGDSFIPFYIFSPVIILGLLSSVDRGFLNGTLRFKILATVGITEAVIKLLFTILLVSINQKQNVYLALPLSMAFSFLLSWFFASRVPEDRVVTEDKKIKFPFKFAGTVILNKLSFVAFLGLDIVIAKIILSPEDAGRFALVSLVGKMVYFFSGLTGQFILPLVSKEEGASGNPQKIFSQIFLVTIFFTAVSYLGLGVFGWLSVPLLFGPKMLAVIQYLPFYLLGIASFTLAMSIISYHQSRKKYLVSIASFAITLIQLFILIRYYQTLKSFTVTLGIFGIIQLLVAGIMHRLTRYSTAITQNSYAFFNLFKSQKKSDKAFEGQIRFLIFNWRDTKHVWAGGAEVYVQELAKNLVEKGHQVTIFCGNDGKNLNSETIDGVEIVRRGGFFTVYIWAAIYYLFKFQDSFDIIIDSENGVPFFTPFYTRRPKLLLIFHVHQEFFRENLKFPMLQIACFMEKVLMPILYKNEKVMTISESSVQDILKLGIFKKEDIFVVNPGVVVEYPPEVTPLTEYPSLVYIGRLKKYKNVDIAVKAFKKVLEKFPDAIFSIGGHGESLSQLTNLVNKLGIQKSVKLLGRVTELQKSKLYQESWVAIQPSSFEGWGITVIEANLFGTPVVASNIHGLRDSIVDGETGILVKSKDSSAFASAINKIFGNKKLRLRMSVAGVERAKKFNWSENTDIFLSAIQRYYLDLNYNENK